MGKRSDSVQEKRLTLAGQILYVGIFLFCFMAYLELFRADYYERKGTLTLLFALIVFFPVLSSIMVEQNLSSIYVVPFAMIPIIVRVSLTQERHSWHMSLSFCFAPSLYVST